MPLGSVVLIDADVAGLKEKSDEDNIKSYFLEIKPRGTNANERKLPTYLSPETASICDWLT